MSAARRSHWIAVGLLAAGLGTLPGCGGGRAQADASAGRIPVLFPVSQRTPERDTPPAVLKLLEQAQRAGLERAQAAAKSTASLADGCVVVTDAGGTARLGPPAPTVRARIIGHQVELLLRYRQLPDRDPCRPGTVTVVVFSGKAASGSFNNLGAVETYAVDGPVGRALVDLPWTGRAPYRLSVSSSNVLGLSGVTVKLPLSCPAAGCLPGYQPQLHSWPLPKPTLPLRGLTRTQLESSVREVVVGEHWPSATTASCASLHSCLVTLVTPGYPKQPYRVRFRIAGQQVSSCWLGWYQGPVDPFPYSDAGTGPLELAGCRDWMK
jgi:hypothetical protein